MYCNADKNIQWESMNYFGEWLKTHGRNITMQLFSTDTGLPVTDYDQLGGVAMGCVSNIGKNGQRKRPAENILSYKYFPVSSLDGMVTNLAQPVQYYRGVEPIPDKVMEYAVEHYSNQALAKMIMNGHFTMDVAIGLVGDVASRVGDPYLIKAICKTFNVPLTLVESYSSHGKYLIRKGVSEEVIAWLYYAGWITSCWAAKILKLEHLSVKFKREVFFGGLQLLNTNMILYCISNNIVTFKEAFKNMDNIKKSKFMSRLLRHPTHWTPLEKLIMKFIDASSEKELKELIYRDNHKYEPGKVSILLEYL